MKIETIFKKMIKDKEKFTQARKGSEFEDRFEDICKEQGFTRKLKDDIKEELEKIKALVHDDFDEGTIENILNEKSNLVDFFVSQPFGSQNYPDFLIFTTKYIIPIEIKYSSGNSKKPMWNGNIPKSNGIYIFGNNKDFTFFKGMDVLPKKEKEKLFEFWNKTAEEYKLYKINTKSLLKEKVLDVEYGFDVYPRKTFQQNKQINPNAIIDFFNNPNRTKLEKSTINYLKKLDEN